MIKCRYPRWLVVLALAATAGSGAWAADNPVQRERDTPAETPLGEQQSGWTFVVVPLQYANAEELAAVLGPTLPAGLRVVPYAPTNSLIIFGRPHER